MSTNKVRPPEPGEVLHIQKECRRMGLRLSGDEIRKVIYAADIAYSRAALAEKDDKPC